MSLRGHAGMVLSLCESPDEHLLASGSEDASVRLWDLRTNRTVRRLNCKHGDDDDGVNCILKRSPTDGASSSGHEWLVASGNRILCFDLRGREESELLIPGPSSTLLTSSDDINDFDYCPIQHALVAANDEGEIHYQLNGLEENKRLRHKGSIAHCARFVAENLVLSGGFDHEVAVSNVKTGKLLFHSKMERVHEFNPPHIFNMDVLHREQGGFACLAVGDGSLCLMRTGAARDWKANWQNKLRLEDVHLAATCCVKFMEQGRIVSAGNDKSLAISGFETDSMQILQQFELENKPNAICYSKTLANTCFVADTTREIKMFEIH